MVYHTKPRPVVNMIAPESYENIDEYAALMTEACRERTIEGNLQLDDARQTIIVSHHHILGDAGYAKYLLRNVTRYLDGEVGMDECRPTGLPESPTAHFAQVARYGAYQTKDIYTVEEMSYVMLNRKLMGGGTAITKLLNQHCELVFHLLVHKLVFGSGVLPRQLVMGQFVNLRRFVRPELLRNCLNFIGYRRDVIPLDGAETVGAFAARRHAGLLAAVDDMDCFANFHDLAQEEPPLLIDVSNGGVFDEGHYGSMDFALTATTSLRAINLSFFSFAGRTHFLVRWGRGQCGTAAVEQLLARFAEVI